jgi:CRISPR/Cas system-associated exonuclease Cas4 (RecB family)
LEDVYTEFSLFLYFNKNNPKDWFIEKERRVDLSFGVYEAFHCSIDFLAIDREHKKITIIDYKSGKANCDSHALQLKLYACISAMFFGSENFDTVSVGNIYFDETKNVFKNTHTYIIDTRTVNAFIEYITQANIIVRAETGWAPSVSWKCDYCPVASNSCTEGGRYRGGKDKIDFVKQLKQ